MTHISGNIVWSEGYFAGVNVRGNQLVLTLGDGSSRYMNFKNWDGSVQETERKAQCIKPGTKVRFATWNGYELYSISCQ